MPSYRTGIEGSPKPGDMNVVIQGLLSFNQLHTAGATQEYVFAAVRDADEALVGGLVAATYLGWLYVHALWLPEHARGQGLGSALLGMVEKTAIERGCTHALLETFDFQALPFYQKHGYAIFSELKDFPPGGSKFALTKPLRPEDQAQP